MALRNPDKEALEDAIRAAANDLNGYVNLPEKRKFIQNEYAETNTGSLQASEVTHDDIREALNSFVEDSQRDIEHIANEVYFVNPFGATPGDDEEIIDRIEEKYRVHIVFSGETLRRAFELPVDHADYFIDSLVDRDLLQRLSRTHDVYTIGRQLEQNSDEPGIAERLAKEAANGIISNDKMENIVDSPVIPAVTSMFEKDGYILDLDGEYIVLNATDDFEKYLAREIEADVRGEFDGPVMLESTFENEVRNHLTANSTRLSKIPDENTREEIIKGVEGGVRERIGLDSQETDESSIVVITTELEDTVREEADSIYPRVAEENHATARVYYESAREEVNDISTDGGELVNEYLREAVLEEIWERIQIDLFDRDLEE